MARPQKINALAAALILLILLAALTRSQWGAREDKPRTKVNHSKDFSVDVDTDRRRTNVDVQDDIIVDEIGNKVLEGEVITVADGDTLTVRDANRRNHRIRLEGIDAPETGQAFGSRAKRELASKVLHKVVRIEWNERDQFDRILGHVHISGRYINGELIAEGFAWRFRNYPSAEFVAAEEKARDAKRGLWSDSKPISPWEYRSRNR